MLKYQNNVFKWIPPSRLTCPRLSLFGSRGKTECEKRDQRERQVLWEGGRLPFFLLSITPRAPLDRVSLWEPEKRPGTSQPTAHTLLY